jgi:predicted secreted protein
VRRLRTLLMALAAFACLGLTPHSPVFTDPTQPVVVDAGEEFFIALASNRTTGYTWSQSIADGRILAYEGNVYQPPSNGLIGAGGQQIFIYHANRTGSTTISFSYARPFEPGTPAFRTMSFVVTVH